MSPSKRNIPENTNVPDRYREEWERPDDPIWIKRFGNLMNGLKSGGTMAMIGKRGTGKTRLAAEALRDGARITGRYATAMEIFLKLRKSFKDEGTSESDIVDSLAEASLLIIDEIQERGDTEWEDRILTHILDRRYGAMRPTIIIGNLTAPALIDALGSSIMSRLNETGAIMEITGPSHRNVDGGEA